MKTYKTLRVPPKLHQKIKLKATAKHQTIIVYLQSLV
jgi:hypothetical protein